MLEKLTTGNYGVLPEVNDNMRNEVLAQTSKPLAEGVGGSLKGMSHFLLGRPGASRDGVLASRDVPGRPGTSQGDGTDPRVLGRPDFMRPGTPRGTSHEGRPRTS